MHLGVSRDKPDIYSSHYNTESNKIYKRSIAGQTWVEITPEGLTYDKAELKQTFPWEEIAGIALYKTYCFLYDKRGGEFLIVTSDEKVKESLLYYLNTKK